MLNREVCVTCIHTPITHGVDIRTEKRKGFWYVRNYGIDLQSMYLPNIQDMLVSVMMVWEKLGLTLNYNMLNKLTSGYISCEKNKKMNKFNVLFVRLPYGSSTIWFYKWRVDWIFGLDMFARKLQLIQYDIWCVSRNPDKKNRVMHGCLKVLRPLSAFLCNQ